MARPTTNLCCLIVPDGTWRKARKMLYLNPLLEGCRG
jgi:DTW domain-containing protein YfiP